MLKNNVSDKNQNIIVIVDAAHFVVEADQSRYDAFNTQPLKVSDTIVWVSPKQIIYFFQLQYLFIRFELTTDVWFKSCEHQLQLML